MENLPAEMVHVASEHVARVRPPPPVEPQEDAGAEHLVVTVTKFGDVVSVLVECPGHTCEVQRPCVNMAELDHLLRQKIKLHFVAAVAYDVQ